MRGVRLYEAICVLGVCYVRCVLHALCIACRVAVNDGNDAGDDDDDGDDADDDGDDDEGDDDDGDDDYDDDDHRDHDRA